MKNHILIVEDDIDTQNLMKLMLRDLYDLSFAESFDGAIKILENSPVNLILMDLSLKGTRDGLHLAGALRAKKQFRRLPIIAVTAHALTTDRDNAIKAGCNEYLSKPFKKSLLLEIIRKHQPEKN